MKNSGCSVPEYMLHLKKPSRDARKALKARAPRREDITRISQWEREQMKKKEQMITASKKRKLKSQETRSGSVKKSMKSKKICSELSKID